MVRADGSRAGHIAIRGGRIEAVEPISAAFGRTPARPSTRPASSCCPGAEDVDTHTRVAGDAEPHGRLGFRGRRVRWHHQFLSFNNPGTGSSPAAERSLLTGTANGERPRTATAPSTSGSASPSAATATTRSRSPPPRSTPGSRPRRRSWSSTSGSPSPALRGDAGQGRHGGTLQVHCEDPVLLDAAIADALQRGDVLPRYHAAARPPFVEAVATAGRSRSRARRTRRSTSSTCARPWLSTRSGAGAAGPRLGRDVPPLPHVHRRGL